MNRPSQHGKAEYQPLDQPVSVDLGENTALVCRCTLTARSIACKACWCAFMTAAGVLPFSDSIMQHYN